MTMPKFEPVGLPDLPAAVSKGNLGTYLFDTMQMHQYAMRYLDLHAEQLTEAYEAGKREQTDELAAARADAKEAWEKLAEQCIAHTATIQQLAAEQAKNVELLEIAKKGLRHYENRNIAHGTRNPAAIALDEIATTPEQSLAKYRNKVIEQMIACYSPDDSAHDYFDKLNAMKEPE